MADAYLLAARPGCGLGIHHHCLFGNWPWNGDSTFCMHALNHGLHSGSWVFGWVDELKVSSSFAGFHSVLLLRAGCCCGVFSIQQTTMQQPFGLHPFEQTN